MKICATKHKCCHFLCISDIGQRCRLAQMNSFQEIGLFSFEMTGYLILSDVYVVFLVPINYYSGQYVSLVYLETPYRYYIPTQRSYTVVLISTIVNM